MNKLEIEHLKEQIIPKIMKGDYVILGIIMNKSGNTARMRFRRNREDAVVAMEKIIKNREQFINKHRK